MSYVCTQAKTDLLYSLPASAAALSLRPHQSLSGKGPQVQTFPRGPSKRVSRETGVSPCRLASRERANHRLGPPILTPRLSNMLDPLLFFFRCPKVETHLLSCTPLHVARHSTPSPENPPQSLPTPTLDSKVRPLQMARPSEASAPASEAWRPGVRFRFRGKESSSYRQSVAPGRVVFSSFCPFPWASGRERALEGKSYSCRKPGQTTQKLMLAFRFRHEN